MTVTNAVPVVATVDHNVAAIVTVTEISEVVSIVIDTELVEKVDIVPDYTTTYEVVYNQIRNTQVIPVLETVKETKIVHSTLCPNYYNNHYY